MFTKTFLSDVLFVAFMLVAAFLAAPWILKWLDAYTAWVMQ